MNPFLCKRSRGGYPLRKSSEKTTRSGESFLSCLSVLSIFERFPSKSPMVGLSWAKVIFMVYILSISIGNGLFQLITLGFLYQGMSGQDVQIYFASWVRIPRTIINCFGILVPMHLISCAKSNINKN